MSDQVAEGQRVFDLLIDDLGPLGLEVECKSFSEDTGRKITRRSALEFFWLVRSNHWRKLRTSPDGTAVVLTVENELPRAYKERVALAQLVASRALAGQVGVHEESGVSVQVSQFEPAKLGADLREGGSRREHQRRVLDEVTGTVNKETVAMSTDAGGALVLAVQSKEDDTLMDNIVRTLKNSASSQFTTARAAMMVAGLEGLSANQMLDIGAQDQSPDALPTALRFHASRFLGSEGRDHIVGAAFLSSSALHPAVADVVDSGGSAYYVPKRESPFWSEDFSGLFGKDQ